MLLPISITPGYEYYQENSITLDNSGYIIHNSRRSLENHLLKFK